MAAHNFERAFALTLKHEGGYVDHPRDPGGATNLGVTIGTLSAWLGRPATKAEVRALTPEKVKPIYRKNYWDAIGADRMESGFDYACYDLAVNSGPARAIKLSKAIRGDTPEARIKALCAARLAFLKRLGTWDTFGKGWGRRVAEVEREALKMAAGSPANGPPAPAKPPPPPAAEAAKAAKAAKSAPAPSKPSLWSVIGTALSSLFTRKG